MPVYSYKCSNPTCPNHYQFDIEASINDIALTNCPKCGCEVNRVYKSAMVSLNFEGSYNSTRNT